MNTQSSTLEPPAAAKLLELVADFLEQEILPVQADEKLRFRVRVAANLLRIARREFESINDFEVDADGYAVPAEILKCASSLRTLVSELHEGTRDLLDPDTLALATRYVEAKLAIAAPGALEKGHGRK